LKEEPLLLLGNTNYKTYLTKLISINRQTIVNVYQDTKLNQLLGKPIFLNKNEATFFLNQIINIFFDSLNKYNQYIIFENIIKK